MAPTVEWKKLKEIVLHREALKNIKSFSPKSLKNLRNKQGKNLLHAATKRGCYDVCKYLIEVGCEVNLKDRKNGYTPLICALIRKKNIKKIIKLLLKHGADTSWTDITIGNQSHALFGTKENIASMLCTSLIKHVGSPKNAAHHLLNKGWTFDSISYLQNHKIIMSALSSNDTLNANYMKLKKAIKNQNVEAVTELLDLVVHSKRIATWALEYAAETPNSLVIIKLLLNKGVPVDGFIDDDSTPPLRHAFLNGNVENCWILLDHGAKFKIWEDLLSLRDCGIKGYQSKEKAKSMLNCMFLAIEHQGVHKLAQDLQDLPMCRYYINHERIEYMCIANHINGHDIFDCNNPWMDATFDMEYYNECSKELKEIKGYKLHDSIKIEDLLMKSIDEMIPLIKFDCLMNKIKSEFFIHKFPRYGKILQFKVKKAFEKRRLINRSIDVLSKCLPLVGSCFLVLEKIVNYLNDPYFYGLDQNDVFPSLIE